MRWLHWSPPSQPGDTRQAPIGNREPQKGPQKGQEEFAGGRSSGRAWHVALSKLGSRGTRQIKGAVTTAAALAAFSSRLDSGQHAAKTCPVVHAILRHDTCPTQYPLERAIHTNGPHGQITNPPQTRRSSLSFSTATTSTTHTEALCASFPDHCTFRSSV